MNGRNCLSSVGLTEVLDRSKSLVTSFSRNTSSGSTCPSSERVSSSPDDFGDSGSKPDSAEAGKGSISGAEPVPAIGRSDALGTSGKSDGSKPASGLDCSVEACAEAEYKTSSCFSFGRGNLDPLTNCVGPFWQRKDNYYYEKFNGIKAQNWLLTSKSSCGFSNSVSEAAGSQSSSCSSAMSFSNFSLTSGAGARTKSNSTSYEVYIEEVSSTSKC